MRTRTTLRHRMEWAYTTGLACMNSLAVKDYDAMRDMTRYWAWRVKHLQAHLKRMQ